MRSVPDTQAVESRLDRFCRALIAIPDGKALQRFLVQEMARVVNAQMGALAVFDPHDETLSVTATHGYPAVVVEHVRIRPAEGVFGRVYASGEPLLVSDAAEIPGQPRRRRYRTNSYLALPLATAEGVLAVIAVTDKSDGGAFDESDLAALSSLAGPAALAISREQLRDRTTDLEHLATVDGLTELFNRRYFETRIEQEIQRQRRQADDLSLLLLDLDNFKELNDSQGHLVGDRVLREVAEILRRAVRIFDVCARYGGEEFVILMPGASAHTAYQVAERIRRQVEQHFSRGLRTGSVLSMTVSIGVSTAAQNTTRETLIAQADTALLHAKSRGKNLVNLHEGGSITA